MAEFARKVKNSSKSLLRKVFELGQHVGVDILPRRFYSEIPVIHELKRTEHWRKPYTMIGVAGADPERQMSLVRSCCTEDLIAHQRTAAIHERACRRNGADGFGPVESDFLFCFIARKRPQRILQIGCGVSTAVILDAFEWAGYRPEITCIEPYPNAFLREAAQEGLIQLIPEKVELLDLDVGELVGEGDLFFVDSTHTLGPAGEVSRIILEMLPRLSKGAWVHFHDITFPYDYSRKVLTKALNFWHESVLLHAFLAFNPQYEIAASLSMLHYERKEALQELLPNYRPQEDEFGLEASPGHFPASTYLRKVG